MKEKKHSHFNDFYSRTTVQQSCCHVKPFSMERLKNKDYLFLVVLTFTLFLTKLVLKCTYRWVRWHCKEIEEILHVPIFFSLSEKCTCVSSSGFSADFRMKANILMSILTLKPYVTLITSWWNVISIGSRRALFLICRFRGKTIYWCHVEKGF